MMSPSSDRPNLPERSVFFHGSFEGQGIPSQLSDPHRCHEQLVDSVKWLFWSHHHSLAPHNAFPYSI
jgi:hypothetical protein